MEKLIKSGRNNPCPVCDRTKDADCGWSPDKSRVLCHTYQDSSPAEINGFYFTGRYCDGAHGPNTQAIYSNRPPKGKPIPANHSPKRKTKSPKDINRDIQLKSAQVEAHTDHLAVMVVEGIHTLEQALVELAQWCKEYGHDRYSAQQMLKGKVRAVGADEGDECRLARRYRRIEAKLKDRLRWNQLRGSIELDGESCDLDELRIKMALAYNIDIPASDCDQICLHLAKRKQFSPVAEYLQRVAAAHPADSDLLDDVASDYLGSDSPLHAAYIRKTLISAVARAMKPGSKVDTVCILSGGQGVGKSTFWKVLAGEYFDDSVGSVSDKDERLKLHKAWLVEWAELEAVFKRKDVSAVKAFITCQVDQIRPPYGRTVMDFARPSIIVGTTNYDEFLADPTGNRRFWVVPVNTDWIPLDQLVTERDRIWAAAYHAYQSGEHWTLPRELRDQAAEENLNYAMSDPWENRILEWVADKEEVTADQILSHALQMDLDRQDRASQMRVTNLLKSNGWRSGRRLVNGRRVRFWNSPNLPLEVGQVGQQKEIAMKDKGSSAAQPTAQPTAQPPAQPSQNDVLASVVNRHEDRVPNRPTCPTSNPTSRRITEDFSVGDRVEIDGGYFSGLRVMVEAVGEERITVKGPNWKVSQTYLPEQLIRVK